MKQIIGILIGVLMCTSHLIAQNIPCTGTGANGSIQILGDDVNLCNDGVHLYLNVIGGGAPGYAGTDTYAVVQNTFNPQPWTLANNVTTDYFTQDAPLADVDDAWSSVINLPFKFCFFGNQYNKFIICANGQLNFDTTLANSGSGFGTTGWTPLPFSSPYANNCILSPVHDIYPGAGSTAAITYDVLGVAPCRRFVVSWNFCPLFSCTSLFTTQQIVLYENTNEIEINLLNKPLCAGWNGGMAFEAIQNNTGTKAFVIPGRNGTQWTATNDSWAFVPAGAPDTNSTIYWMDSATNVCLDTGWTFDYYPTQEMAVYVIIGDTAAGQGCGNIQSPYKHLYVQNAVVDWVSSDVATCNGGTTTFTITNTNATSFTWDFGDGTTLTTTNTVVTHTYAGLGPFNATCTVSFSTCTDVESHIIQFFSPPMTADFTSTGISYCSGGIADFDIINILNANTFVWSWGDGQTSLPSTNTTASHTFVGLGPFIVKLYYYQAGEPCLDSITHVIQFTPIPIVANFTTSADSICTGTNISTFNTSIGGTGGLTYSWAWGDGTANTTGNNATHTYTTSGSYTITLTATDAYNCSATYTQVVYVDAIGTAKLNVSKTMACVGEAINFENIVGPNTKQYWLEIGINNIEYYNKATATYNYLFEGDYTAVLHVQPSVCPAVTDAVDIHIDKYPILELGGPVKICPGRDVVTILDNDNPGATYLWSNGSTQNTITVNSPGMYTLTASYNTCATTATKQIIGDIDCIFKPNVFSPNNDGNNDYYKPVFFSLNDISYYNLDIFDRWGKKMYSSTNKFDKGWNGTYANLQCDAGTYIYVLTIELIDGAKKQFNGDFILLR